MHFAVKGLNAGDKAFLVLDQQIFSSNALCTNVFCESAPPDRRHAPTPVK